MIGGPPGPPQAHGRPRAESGWPHRAQAARLAVPVPFGATPAGAYATPAACPAWAARAIAAGSTAAMMDVSPCSNVRRRP